MSVTFNRATLIGFVGANPTTSTFSSGNTVTRFNIITTDKFVNKKTNEEKNYDEWHSIVVMNKTITPYVENYVKKGDLVLVEGEIKTRKYTNKNGVEMKCNEIVLSPFKGHVSIIRSKIPYSPTDREQHTSVLHDDDVLF